MPLATSRYPGLDALRAAAILLVMLFHAHSFVPEALQPVAGYGWMGVDLFFVLSGYLIASQLFREHRRTGRIHWPGFYRRRIFRVLPLYLTVLVAYLALPRWREAPVMAPPWEYFTLTYNLFVHYPAQRAFSHVWSLCVEEQFYLAFPLLLLLLLRRPSSRRTVGAAAAIFVLGLAWRAWVFYHLMRPLGPDSDDLGSVYIERIYYPTWSRMDGLLAGVCLAAIETYRPALWRKLQRCRLLFGTAGLACTGVCCWLFRSRTALDSVGATATIVGYPLLSLGIAAIVFASLGNDNVARIPGARTLAQIGATLAFATYLSHKIVLQACTDHLPERIGPNTWTGLLLFLAGSGTLAAILYGCIERPGLKLRGNHPNATRHELETDPAL